jgi:hemerythrin-like domain-containing protein
MRATQIIMGEHRVIETMLDALQAMAGDYAAGSPPRGIARLLDFFETYADAAHHEKEERILFPALERHGLRPNASLVGALVAQHESCRGLVRELREQLAAPGDAAARRLFGAVAREYAEVLRLHIRLEDQFLREIVGDGSLPPVEDEALAAAMFDADARTFTGSAKSDYEADATTWRQHRAH